MTKVVFRLRLGGRVVAEREMAIVPSVGDEVWLQVGPRKRVEFTVRSRRWVVAENGSVEAWLWDDASAFQ